MKVYKQLALAVLLLTAAASATAVKIADDTISAEVKIWPEEGWMKNGWGKVFFTVENKTDNTVELVKSQMQWMANGNVMLDPWSNDFNTRIDAGQTQKQEIMAWYNPHVLEAAENKIGQIKGAIVYTVHDKEKSLDYVLDVPEATLAEPLKKVKGQYVTLNLMESRYDGIDNIDTIITGMDAVYQAMADLTGHRPYDAANVEYKECPRNFAWAYAGNPIVLNTSYVKESIDEYNSGLINFGWTHELGHDFDDSIGHWYIVTGEWAEFQANIKLSYAWETVADGTGDFLVRLWEQGGSRTKLPKVTGRQFNDSYFLTFGMGYLADSDRSWESLKSDELHSFHSLLVRRYGWDILKQTYRTYVAFNEKGLKPPKDKAEKVNLMCAVMSKAVGKDLSAVYQQWRMPVTAEGIKAAKEKYPVEEVTQAIGKDRCGMYADKLPDQSNQMES